MCSKAMVMVMAVMVMLVMPVAPRPHQAPHDDKIDSAVSESMKVIETAVKGSVRLIKHAIEESVAAKMAEQRVSQMSDSSAQAVRNVLSRILAARKAAALRNVAAPFVLSNVKDAEGGTGTTHPTGTTTMDPLEEYCKEACEAGIGGPECDCPDHPIG